MAEENSFKFDFLKFFRRRCHRLIPPYAFALILTVILDCIGMMLYPTLYQGATGDALLDINFIRKEYTIESIFPALILLPTSMGKDFGSNGPLWSLAYEIVYYSIYPVWLIFRRRISIAAYILGILIATFSAFFISGDFLRPIFTHYPIWLCGAAMAEILTKYKYRKKYFLPVSLFGFILAFFALQIPDVKSLKLVFYAFLGTGLVLSMLYLPPNLLKSRILRFFESWGVKSYTVYICHFPMVTLVSAWIIETQGSRPNHGWLAIFTFLGVLLLCNLFFFICESHFLHSRIKLNPKQS